MRANPFDGKGVYTRFVWKVYDRFMKREWFSHADVMADYLRLKSARELPYSVSKCSGDCQLKKAFRDVVRILRDKCGDSCIEIEGNNRNKRYRYVGDVDEPLEDLKNAQAIKDVTTYAQFCIDSAGFFPKEWIEYFLEDTLDLLKIKRRKNAGEQYVASSIDRELTNIHLLPMLYETIRDKRVLSIDYAPYYEEKKTLTVHPHILKEYNGRWFLFGFVPGENPELGYNLAIDRIQGTPSVKPGAIEYVPAPKNFYRDFFRSIVGVSHSKGVSPKEIVIRTYQRKIFHLTETKKIHPTQVTIKGFGEYEDGTYGEFIVTVEPNNEFIGRILQMGDGFEIMAPLDVRDIFRQRVSKMADLYKD